MLGPYQRLPTILNQLPPLPAALSAALDVIRDDRSQRADLIRVLALDQSLTGMFLRMVNSAYYALPRRITSLDEAIGYLGFETVESVIFAVSASKLLAGPLPAYMLGRGMLWQHAVAVASATQWIAHRRNIATQSDAYVAGLLHDVGKLVLDLMVEHRAEWGTGVREDTEDRTWLDVERQITGLDHAEVGAVLLRSWNMPDRVVDAVAYHHAPDQATVDVRLTAAVHVANVAALMAGVGLGIDGLNSRLDGAAIEQLSWTTRDMEGVMDNIMGAVSKARDLLRLQAPM